VAHANPAADELGQHGVDLAASGRFSEAIEAFKAADRIESNAAHSCLIALAYTRRELWSQAEIFLARCHALGASELPDWIPDLESLIAERLGEATVAAVHIDVAPAGAPAQLSVSSFLPDETFAPGTTIHLSRGHHVITATAAGFEDEHYSIDIADTSPKLVVIQLYRPGTRPKPPSPLPRAMMIGGAATIAAGAVAYGVMGIARPTTSVAPTSRCTCTAASRRCRCSRPVRPSRSPDMCCACRRTRSRRWRRSRRCRAAAWS
jgi:hypothetical protein